jgi:hypothetical protein
MYFYTRLPISPRWAHQLPTQEAVAGFLGLGRGDEIDMLLARDWVEIPPEHLSSWRAWRPRAVRTRAADGPTYKLYVSPRSDHLRECLRVVVRTLADEAVVTFKIGRDLDGVLRPDKLMIYSHDAATLGRIAERLRHALGGMPAHGVPFTACVDDHGLLSRGVDPPESERLPYEAHSESWRAWIADRLAVYLLTARATRSRLARVSATEFALGRLALDGVSTRTWEPLDTTWVSSAAREN